MEITKAEIYCEQIDVLVDDPEGYVIMFSAGRYPVDIASEQKWPMGIIREIREENAEGSIVSKRIEVTILQGKEFFIGVIVHAAETIPVRAKYTFGERAGRLFFEEYK